jgi:ubiquinone/menaquinone biosynthesis C-methylase UbiE
MTDPNAMLNQCRKPTGWWGRFTLRRMNWSHSKLTDWGLSLVHVRKDNTVLDVGCGGGRTVSKLAAMAVEGKVYGIDYSDDSVAATRSTNAKWIDAGRVEVRQASVSQLPFDDNTFDLVTAVETHFFWPNLAADVREILRVTKSGGTLVIIAEIYKGATTRTSRLCEKYAPLTGMKLLSPDEHRDLLAGAGYVDVRVIEKRDNGWICAIGQKSRTS